MNSSEISHLEPKLLTLVVSVSLVCGRAAGQRLGAEAGGGARGGSRLGVEGRVLHQRVDEHPQVVLHLEPFHARVLVLLLNALQQLAARVGGGKTQLSGAKATQRCGVGTHAATPSAM
jgi:hypothetical protein